ncbi:MAG TPA: RNA-binding protein [Spirochaetia bacterium]|nr:RNA-binding protein [Spirochaetia bacterium]
MTNKIYVGNMSYDTEETTLRELFAGYGEVKSITIVTDRYTGASKGFGFVEMGTEEEAKAAIVGLDDKEVDGRNLRVKEAYDKPQRSPKRY